MATEVERDDDGNVVLVESDRKVTDPDSEEAVQVPVALNQERNAREVNAEPSANDVSEDSAAEMVNPNKPAKKSSSKSSKDE